MTRPGCTGTTWRQNSNRHSGRVPHLRDHKSGARCKAKQGSCYWRFLILRVSYTTSTLPMGKQLTRNSTSRSCNVCINQFAENDWKSGGMVTGSRTTTVHPHTLQTLCSSFSPNTALISCSSCHTQQILHRMTFSYSQGLRKFCKDTDLRQWWTSDEIQWRHIRHPKRGVRKMFLTVAAALGEVCSRGRELCWRQLGLKPRKLYLLHVLWSVQILLNKTRISGEYWNENIETFVNPSVSVTY